VGSKLSRRAFTILQDGVAERWDGSIHQEMVDDVIPLNEQYLKRLSLEYVRLLSRRQNYEACGVSGIIA
jgi:hypothetical protein